MLFGKYGKGLKQFEKYLLNSGAERSKDHLAFPLFQKLFGNKFRKEADAEGADTYVEGKLLVELKSDSDDWRKGFYQALHYAKKGLTFSATCVVAQKFVAVWKVNSIPDFAKRFSAEADATVAPSDIGVLNARKTSKAQATEILKSAVFKLDAVDLEGLFDKNHDTALREFVQVLRNLDAERIQINTHNFIDHIARLEQFFDNPMDAVHCFYAIVGFWDVTSTVATDESDEVSVVGKRGSKVSEKLKIKPRFHESFKKYVEGRYVFTNEGSGLTVDYYFSRFDEVITRIMPDYAKQHGIFFTDNNLSKFALWFVHEFFEKRLSDKYVVLDPAGGSGNLVTSWKGHLKHKVISELQPDLLKTIERRMRLDPEQVEGGFTIIPKTSTNQGLNFLDKSAEQYVSCLMKELKEKNFKFDKPIAFLLNPPYKNTDENEEVRDEVGASYHIHPSILQLTGNDAGSERYLAFLGQIINISRVQMGEMPIPDNAELNFEDVKLPAPLDTKKVQTPLILIFTPTSWLIPRPTYVEFRKTFDKYFKYEMGFIVTGNEFFKIQGRFPISFTIWSYRHNEKGNNNRVIVRDLTALTGDSLQINWNLPLQQISKALRPLLRKAKSVKFSQRQDIRELLPKTVHVSSGESVEQARFNLYRNKLKEEEGKEVISGFPKRDDRHKRIKDPHGFVDGAFVGFMDDNTPVRTKQDNYGRMSNHPDRVWFRLDVDLKGANKTRCLGGCPDNRGYCAYDLGSAKATFLWFALTKALNGVYPVWAN